MSRISLFMALLTLSFLAACKTTQPPVVTTVTKTVDKPVAVACLKPGQVPVRPRTLTEDSRMAPSTMTERVARYRAKLLEWNAYGKTSDKLLRLCSSLPQPTKTQP